MAQTTENPDDMVPGVLSWLLEQYFLGAITTARRDDPVSLWRLALMRRSLAQHLPAQVLPLVSLPEVAQGKRGSPPPAPSEPENLEGGPGVKARAYIMEQIEAEEPIDRAHLLGITGWSEQGINNMVRLVQDSLEREKKSKRGRPPKPPTDTDEAEMTAMERAVDAACRAESKHERR